MPLGVQRWSLIDGLCDHEDSILDDYAWRIDDQRAGELRVESGTEASPEPHRGRERHRALPGAQGAPILVRSHAANDEGHVAGILRRDDERILYAAMLAQAANDQRIVERIPDDGMNRRLFAECRNSERGVRVAE